MLRSRLLSIPAAGLSSRASLVASRAPSALSTLRPAAASASRQLSTSTGGGESRWRGPVTWLSASVTIAGLYGLYQYQYQRQLSRQRSVGKPDLGGPFELVDPDGKTVRSKDLVGQWVLIYFGFTKCPDICPEEMEKVTTVLHNLEASGRQIQPVFITIDPSRDTQARLKEYFDGHDFHKKTIALTGSHDAIKKACRAYRVYFTRPLPEEIARGDYLLDHSIISYLVDPEGNFVDYFGKSLSQDEMQTKMGKAIDAWETEKWWDRMTPSFMRDDAVSSGRQPEAAVAAAK